MNFSLKNSTLIITTLLSGVLYYLFAFETERTQFAQVVVIWTLLFAGYYFFVKNSKISTNYYLAIAILFRLIFLATIPNLSQDFYRFIWDGRMIFEGFNPYISLPETFITEGNLPVNQAKELYAGMGEMNGSHYTNYPPLNQLCFYIAALLSNNSILGAAIVMRCIIILADVGIFYFGHKLLKNINKNPNLIFLYLLNPFIIIELTGNLHFEPVMLFFLIWSLYHLQKKNWIVAGFLLAFSINVKLIPLLFLPLFFRWFLEKNNKLQWNQIGKLALFYAIVILMSLALFVPFFSNELIDSYSNSIGLWFRNFEFNASFYYILREIGYLFRGYNEIAVIGKISPVLTILFLAYLTFFKKNISFTTLATSMLFGLSFYYFTTTTMHPWYISTLIILSVFTKYRFPLVWSLVIILSYQAYANTPWKENLWFVFLEYIVMYLYLLYEIKKPTQRLSGKNCYEKEKESGL
ncbi:mannosyltransferase [uncultured Tenacibaculum sp.]|uniref:mannosyltransferase n=1 Tax=uncultured Tenacibaculum sp. TaxID=174713 RepID=UPI00261F0287|nr:mannosyltransferase [uncultured Tenacibaculum sp.]